MEKRREFNDSPSEERDSLGGDDLLVAQLLVFSLAGPLLGEDETFLPLCPGM